MRHYLTTLALILLAADVRAAGPTCALLDPEKTPRAALLEAKLLVEPGAAWVERAGIDKVLAEQKLQTAFGPQGVGERVRLGKLLKADVLVLVRSVKGAKEPALEVVVSETASGLRLLLRAVPVTKSADEDVAALLAAAKDGIKRHAEKIEHVVAVPPFVSNDLGYQFDHLKGAFAKLAESVALDRKGVVVVELAEAEALAKEIALAAPGAKVERPSPLYLVGEYRHEGRDAERTVTLKLRTERAGKLVGKPETFTVKAAAAPEALRKWAAGVLDATGAAVALPDPKAEVKRLAELIAIHQRLGNWNEALALIEASLLLDPKQPEHNADAMMILRNEIQRLVHQQPKTVERLRPAAALHCRGLAHMEALIKSGAKLPRYEGLDAVRGGRWFWSMFPTSGRPSPYWSPFAPPPPDPPEVAAIVREVQEEVRATAARVLPSIVEQGHPREITAMHLASLGGLRPWPEVFAERGSYLLKHQDTAAIVSSAESMLTIYAEYNGPDDLPAFRALLDRLEKEGNAGLVAAVGRARQRLPQVEKEIAQRLADAAEKKRLAELAKKVVPKVPASGHMSRAEALQKFDSEFRGGPFKRIELKAATKKEEWFLERLNGSIAAGPGVDVFWSNGYAMPPQPGQKLPPQREGYHGPTLLVMKEKGVLQYAWEKYGAPERFTRVAFDGKYVWFSTESMRAAPALFLFDPASGNGFEVTGDDGLPQPPEEIVNDRKRLTGLRLVITPLEPGRVCVSGGFGRGWIALVKFDEATKKPSVKVVHEARDVPKQGETRDVIWKNPSTAFVPQYAFVLEGAADVAGKRPVRVLIGRGYGHFGAHTNDNAGLISGHPLLLDPESGKVEVMQDTVYLMDFASANAINKDGAVYFIESPPSLPDTRLSRLEYPGVLRVIDKVPGPRAYEISATAIAGERLYFTKPAVPKYVDGTLTYQPEPLLAVDLTGKNYGKAAEKAPIVKSLTASSHYGFVAWCDLVPGICPCEAVLPPMPKK